MNTLALGLGNLAGPDLLIILSIVLILFGAKKFRLSHGRLRAQHCRAHCRALRDHGIQSEAEKPFGPPSYRTDPTRERQTRFIVFIEETTRTNKFISLEQPGPKRVTDKAMSQKIIDFEPGRKALKKNGFDDKQNPVTLMERSRVPFRLPEDWLEFLLTVVLFVGLLSGLVGGVIASWRF